MSSMIEPNSTSRSRPTLQLRQNLAFPYKATESHHRSEIAAGITQVPASDTTSAAFGPSPLHCTHEYRNRPLKRRVCTELNRHFGSAKDRIPYQPASKTLSVSVGIHHLLPSRGWIMSD